MINDHVLSHLKVTGCLTTICVAFLQTKMHILCTNLHIAHALQPKRFMIEYCLPRELGGALCAVWSSYIASETRLIFVIDSSDIASIALVSGLFQYFKDHQPYKRILCMVMASQLTIQTGGN